ncbi:heme A synthase [Thermoleophilia bacterium SCSIO 60948]|nr:heme A synthase [Thermoleophilia bacterium SCSIO 60948]
MSTAAAALRRLRTFTLTKQQYFAITVIALVSLVTIVASGSAVRLTGSGLGCPDWPRCYGKVVPPGDLNAIIEYGNRLFTGVVGIAVIAAATLSFRRRPFRWHLAVFGLLLPLGVLGQAALGAIVVANHLAPELVMGHFILSMILLDAAFALMWCSRYEPGERRASTDRVGVWAVRGLIPVGQLAIIAGTMTTGSGPHAGDFADDRVTRFTFQGPETLEWMVQRHAALAVLFAVCVAGVILFLRRGGGDRRAQKPLLVLLGLICLQIAVGVTQWLLELPAELVWVHIVIATLTWLSVLWSVATAGRIQPRDGGMPVPNAA